MSNPFSFWQFSDDLRNQARASEDQKWSLAASKLALVDRMRTAEAHSDANIHSDLKRSNPNPNLNTALNPTAPSPKSSGSYPHSYNDSAKLYRPSRAKNNNNNNNNSSNSNSNSNSNNSNSSSNNKGGDGAVGKTTVDSNTASSMMMMMMMNSPNKPASGMNVDWKSAGNASSKMANNGNLNGNVNANPNAKSSGGGHGNNNNNNNNNNGNLNSGSQNAASPASDKRFKTLPPAESLPRHEALGGYIFVCNNDTMQEDLKRQLFGLPQRYRDSVRAITPGLPLFLYNYTTHQLHGIFEALTFGGSNIDPTAWEDKKNKGESRFPAQVRTRIRKFCKPLEEDAFRPVLHHYDGPKFRLQLSVPETLALLDLFAEAGSS